MGLENLRTSEPRDSEPCVREPWEEWSLHKWKMFPAQFPMGTDVSWLLQLKYLSN